MPRLPDMESLGATPIPESRRRIASDPSAGIIGRSVEGLGQTIAQIGEQQLAVRDKVEYAAADAARLKAKTDIITSLRDDPDYGTFDQRFRDGMDKSVAAASSLIRNKEDRAIFEAQSAGDVEQGSSIVQGMARTKRISARVAVGTEAADAYAKIALNAPDDETRVKALAGAGGIYDGLLADGSIDADTAQKLKRQFYSKFGDDSVRDATTRGDTEEAKRRLGILEPIMSADSVLTSRSDIQTEERRQQALAASKAALAKAAAEKSIAETNAKLSAGVDVPDAELAQQQALAQSIGDPAKVVDLQAARVKSSVNRETQGWTPSQFAANIATLRAKGEKRSDMEDMRLKQLETISDTRTAEFNKDPYAWGALNGFAARPLNFSDPGSIAARQHLQTTLEGPAGQPIPFLKPDEVDHYRAIAEASPKGRFSVVNTMAAIPDPHTAQQAIRQILPGDALAARLVVLNPSVRAGVVSGAEVRKADKTIIDGKGPNDPGTAAFTKYQHDVEPALALLRPEDAEATYQIAGNLYANWAHQNGVHDFSPDQFGSYLHMALGARRDATGVFHGGVGYWNDKPVLLPSSQSQRQFETTLSRMNFSEEHAPHYANGTVMPKAAILKLTPVQRPDGFYEFHGDNGQIATGSDGSVWRLDIDKLGKALGIAK